MPVLSSAGNSSAVNNPTLRGVIANTVQHGTIQYGTDYSTVIGICEIHDAAGAGVAETREIVHAKPKS